ncbi:hypothetical protein NQ176_g3760 [Zarea fungicola]|uniref:Uncharacterized protein n=1 Tax=Zarea fungicola TaxID=93591 RepID=A0ACC1NIW1_9HYPO|nr:hypothetical protein NQ176_g3760 [Lecanicillium fungicola]
MAPKKLAIVIGSTRTPRIGPHIAEYLANALKALAGAVTIDIIDIADFALPVFDEPNLPLLAPAGDPTPFYAHSHTRKWSAAIRPFDAFIFVTPEYNAGIPGALKNAIDFLFQEWTGKPAAIVSYGSTAGKKSAAHLRDVLLHGVYMKPVETMIGLQTGITSLDTVMKTGTFDPQDVERWQEAGFLGQVETMFNQLVSAVNSQ